MGANNSRHRYEYGYPDSAREYNARGQGYGRGAPLYGQPAGVMPPVLYPLVMQPMQHISGPLAIQPQQQPVMQMPQPGNINGQAVPANPVPPLPVPQMQQPGLAQPQPQHAFTPGAAGGIPASIMQQGSVFPGITPVIPRSFARRERSDSSDTPSDSGTSSRSRRRRRRRRRWRSRDPLEHNPLPAPPREVDAPDDLLAGTAMAPRGPPLPRSPSPLRNPLPPPPRDVYTLRKYRPLLIGTAYADRKKEVYPTGWFDNEDRSDREGNIGRVFERLNPFRPNRDSEFSPRHRRSETMPVLPDLSEFVRERSATTSETSPGERRPGLGRSLSSRLPFGRRRRANEPVLAMLTPGQGQPPSLADGQAPPSGFMQMPSPHVPGPTDQPQAVHPLSPLPPQVQSMYPLTPGHQPVHPLTPGPPQPQPVNPLSPVPPQSQPVIPITPSPVASQTIFPPGPGFPQPQGVNPLTPGPPQSMPMPIPGRALSPVMPPLVGGEGPGSPSSHTDSTSSEIIFDESTPGYGELTHLGSLNVFYQGKLYPTAAHLFEAFKFLGKHKKLAERVRQAQTLPELEEILNSNYRHWRPDWEEVAIDKMEEALYHKIIQHRELTDTLLRSGEAELIYSPQPSDLFWGEGGNGEGANELGRALMRIRDRLRHEQAAHESRVR